MELALSLGDPSKLQKLLPKSSENHLQKKTSLENGGPNFCMALGLKTYSAENEETEKIQKKSQDSEDDENADGPNFSEKENTDIIVANNSYYQKVPLQLSLLPGAPVPRRISLTWSSDNGSSENGSSENAGRPPVAVRAAEEASSANSEGSAFRLVGGNNKRSFEAADEDEEGGPHGRKKLRLSKQQSAFLEQTFKDHNTLNPKQKMALAKQLNLRPRQVEVWFQNRRARTKLKQTEVDCEYLKRCCEALGDENRRLQKELQELRALKISAPFYMQSPATTLTMCPSCKRVSSSATKTDDPFSATRPKFFPLSRNLARINSHNQPAGS
ncbi:homeobox-leucine zipper protein family [Striga asiatica]|uniref:Homeobox-leucine zipper protein family n=1 Tax=Striga asiatica TaxID=4170 RepID=A0A5A7QJK4_STRAF|nr:homeobox-leucine zipper protein family [Striga asiatica]